MRDLLTALAGVIVLVLVAALAVPPFVDWPAQRASIDHAVSASLGVPVRSEGPITVRLLPSPHVRFDRLIVGEPGGPALDARAVDAEIALPPLLQSEVRVFDTRIGRAELRLPLAGDDALRLPPRLLTELRGRKLAIDDLHVGQFTIVTAGSDMAASERFSATDLRIGTPSLLGPWRVEGTSGGVPFRAVSGTPDAEGALPVKISGGGDTAPTFEVDARLGIAPSPSDPGATVVSAEGKTRLVVGPPTQASGAYLPFTLAGTFAATGLDVRFDPVSLEVDPGGKPLRLEGTGRLDLHRWRAGLTLRARRLDLDAFLTSPEGGALLARGIPRGGWGLPVMLDLDTAVDSAAFGGSEWSGLTLAATLERGGGLLLRRFAAAAPGDATVTASGEVEGTPLQLNGPVSLAAPRSDELGRLLRRLGLDDPLLGLFDGRPLDLAADVSASADNLSLRNLRATIGTARLTGNARLVAPTATARGRFDAQLRASGLDIAALPSLATALDALRTIDFALTLQAQDVRYGPVAPGKTAPPGAPSGTIAARIQSNGPSLVVDSLDITDLAGASAKLSGTLAADGSGRIGGRIQAPVAAPLVGLLERVWTGDLRRLPAFLREAPLDLAVTLDREATTPAGLRLQAQGRAGGGTIDLAATSRDGRLVAGRATLAASSAAPWFGRSDIPALGQAAEVRLTADPSPGGLAITLAGSVAGTTLATLKPMHWPAGGGWPSDGDIRLRSADLTPVLTLAGAAQLDPGPWPAEATVSFGVEAGSSTAGITGQVAGGTIDARLLRGPDGTWRGRVGLDRLALPQLAAALVMPQAGPRFGPLPERPPAALDLTVASLGLGRGLSATKASFTLGLDADSLTLGTIDGTLAEGRLTGSASLARRGETLSITGEGRIEDAALSALTGTARLGGRLSAEWRAATSADTEAGLAADLAGGGRLTLTGLTLADLDPTALGRALARTVEGDDPLREGRLAALLTEELGKGAEKGAEKGTPKGAAREPAKEFAKARGPASAPATIVGGVLRAGPLTVDFGTARWVGTLTESLRDGRLEARGLLTDEAVPPGWQAGLPTVQLTLAGAPGALERSVDVGPLSNGLAAFVLQRELDQIGLLQADDLERQRRRARIEMDKARVAAKAAAEEAAKETARAAAREAAARDAAAKEVVAREAAAKEAAAKEAAAKEAAAREAAAKEAAERDPAANPPVEQAPAAKTPD